MWADGSVAAGGQMGRVMSAVSGRRDTGPVHEARARGPCTGPVRGLNRCCSLNETSDISRA